MQIATCCGALTILIMVAGCRSNENRASHMSTGQTPGSQPTYRVELIPNTQLTATSREGDKHPVVYSKNIAAVYREEGAEVKQTSNTQHSTSNIQSQTREVVESPRLK